MKIAVLGTGANGSCVAADLTRAGLDVVLIDQWPEHVATMRANGLRVTLNGETTTTPVRALHLCEVATLRHPFDIVLLVPKAYDTRWMCELIAPHLAPDGILVPLQNAMTTQDAVDIVGASRVVACVVELASDLFEPGVVQRHTPNARTWFGLGGMNAVSQARVAEIDAMLGHVGKTAVLSKVLDGKWMKLVVNAVFLGFFGTLGGTIRAAAELPGIRPLMLRIGLEAVAAGESLGYTAEPIFGVDASEARTPERLLERLFDKLTRDIGPNARPAVLHDHIKHRYSEVDAINGAVVTALADQGRPAPANDAIVAVTRRIYARELQPALENLMLIREMLDR
jgi:2-dehydropantoate 2-reductase